MDPVRYQRVKELLLAALERPSEERDRFLDAECGDDVDLRREVQELLDQEESAHGLLDRGVLGEGTQDSLRATVQSLGDAAAPPERIGPYDIVGVLGEGGMGMVYHGRQSEPVVRDVAVKVLRPGLDGARVLARFEWERRALARLDHPNVARVLDAGTDPVSQRPYVALPLIVGDPITRWCERNEPSLEVRLQLFLRVCRAVEHAHARGILHRDLKPGNVMVQEIDGEAVPVVIDFGIAKALDRETTGIDATMTVDGQRIGTPAYMSPEQLQGDPGDVDVRSDVFALGVILWEMLTGEHPYGDAADSVTRALEVGRTPPALGPPSRDPAARRSASDVRWRRRLRGDLDTICLRAVEFDRVRRYASAAHLGDDVQRFLEGRPILARPDSWSYRIGKSIRRHPVLSTAVAGGLAVLLTGTALLAINAQRLQVQRDRALSAEARAQDEALQARSIADFLVELFTEVNPVSGDAADLSARELLAQGARRARVDLAEQPELRGPLLYTIGSVQHELGLYAPAETLLVEAISDLDRTPEAGRDSLEVSAYRLLAINRHDQGRYAEAERGAREALDLVERFFGRDDPRYATILSDLGIYVQAQGRLEDAIEVLKGALERQEAAADVILADVSWTQSSIGYVLSKLGRYEDAAPWMERAYETFMQQPEDERNAVEQIYVLNNLGGVHLESGRFDSAHEHLSEALALCLELYGNDHPVVGRAYTILGQAYLRGGDLETATDYVEKGVEVGRRVAGPDHRFTLRSTVSLIELRHVQGRTEDALALAIDTVGRFEREGLTEDPHYTNARHWVARLYLERDDAARALPYVETVLETFRADRDDDSAAVLEARVTRAWAWLELGRADEAADELQAAAAALRARRSDDDEWVRRATALLARARGDSR